MTFRLSGSEWRRAEFKIEGFGCFFSSQINMLLNKIVKKGSRARVIVNMRHT